MKALFTNEELGALLGVISYYRSTSMHNKLDQHTKDILESARQKLMDMVNPK